MLTLSVATEKHGGRYIRFALRRRFCWFEPWDAGVQIGWFEVTVWRTKGWNDA